MFCFLIQVIFVLSHHFVNSDWCNYELYFAQQRAIGKTFSDVILVVKEPIDPESLPSKYCKLKKMLYTKTYLEWPQQAKQQTFFWAQLRSCLGKPTVTREQALSGRSSSVSSVGAVPVIELPLEDGKPAIAMPHLDREAELHKVVPQEIENLSVRSAEFYGQRPIHVAVASDKISQACSL
jgi:hypothetical protein